MKKGFNDKSKGNSSVISNDYRIDSWKIHTHKLTAVIDEPEKYIGDSTEICSQFGCGRKLSLTEQLCGNKCTKCQGEEKVISDSFAVLEMEVGEIMGHEFPDLQAEEVKTNVRNKRDIENIEETIRILEQDQKNNSFIIQSLKIKVDKYKSYLIRNNPFEPVKLK